HRYSPTKASHLSGLRDRQSARRDTQQERDQKRGETGRARTSGRRVYRAPLHRGSGDRAGPLRSNAYAVPHLPRRIASGVDVFELLAILERIHGHPKTVILVSAKTFPCDEPLKRLTDELLAIFEMAENLLP